METIELVAPSEYELERGKPIPSKAHAFIQSNLIFWLRTQHGNRFTVLPELNLQLPEGRYVVPDLAVFPPMKIDVLNDEIRVTEVPLAVVEILSPQQPLPDVTLKSEIYFELGVQSYWLVIPPLRSVYVFDSPRNSNAFVNDEVLRDPHLQVEIPLSEIFG
jgi:Uma2 family endonuclease